MSRPWEPDKARARAWMLLKSAPGQKASRAWLVEQMPDVEAKGLSNALHQMVQHGYLIAPDAQGGEWAINPAAGEPPIRGTAGEQPQVRRVSKAARQAGPAAELSPRQIAEQCDALICKSANGMTSAELAEMFDYPQADIEHALAPLAEARHYVTCTVLREGVRALSYRRSGSMGKPYDFAAQAAMTWGRRLAQMAAETGEPVDAKPRVAPAPAPEPAAPPAPFRVPEPAVTDRGFFDRALTRPAQTATAPAPAAAPFPAAADRPNVPIFLDSIPMQGETREELPDTDFICALFSNGKLQLQLDGQVITLNVEQTRTLLHYLDHMDGGAVVSDADRNAQAA